MPKKVTTKSATPKPKVDTTSSDSISTVIKRNPHVPRDVFIRAWETSETAQEVSDKIGSTVNTVLARASKCRTEYDIPLKYFKRGGAAKVNRDEALKLIAELRGISVKEVVDSKSNTTSATN